MSLLCFANGDNDARGLSTDVATIEKRPGNGVGPGDGLVAALESGINPDCVIRVI
jgi:hypothetical protein